jgi:hypothetical protein
MTTEQPTTITVSGKTYELSSFEDVTETARRHNVPTSTTDGRVFLVRYFTGKRWMMRYVKPTDRLA